MGGDEQERFFSLPPSPSPSSPLLSSTELQYSGLHHVDPRKWHFRESRILQDFEEDDEDVVVDVDEALDSELVEPLVVPGATDTCLESLVFLLDKWTCEDACDSQVPSHTGCLFSGGYESWYDDLDDDALFSPAVLSLGDSDQMACDPPIADMGTSGDTLSGYACSSVPPSPARSPAEFLRSLDFAFTSPPQAVPGDFDTPSQTHVSLLLCLGERISLVPSSPLALAAPPPVVATHAFWGSPSLLDLDSEAQPAALPEPYVPGSCDALETLRRGVSLNCAASPAQSYSSLFDGPQDDFALSELQDARSAYFDCDESAALVSPVLSPNPFAGHVLPSAWQARRQSDLTSHFHASSHSYHLSRPYLSPSPTQLQARRLASTPRYSSARENESIISIFLFIYCANLSFSVCPHVVHFRHRTCRHLYPHPIPILSPSYSQSYLWSYSQSYPHPIPILFTVLSIVLFTILSTSLSPSYEHLNLYSCRHLINILTSTPTDILSILIPRCIHIPTDMSTLYVSCSFASGMFRCHRY